MKKNNKIVISELISPFDIVSRKWSKRIKKLVLSYKIISQFNNKKIKLNKKNNKIKILKKITEKKNLPYSKLSVVVFQKKKINKKIKWKKKFKWKKKNIRYHRIFNSWVIKRKKWNIKKKNYEKFDEILFKSDKNHQFINLGFIQETINFFKKFDNYQNDKKKIELYNKLSNKMSVHSNFYFIIFAKLNKCNFNKIKKTKFIENFYDNNNFFNVFFKKYNYKSIFNIKNNYKIDYKKNNFNTNFFRNIFKTNKKIINSYNDNFDKYFFTKFVYYIFFNFIKFSNFKKETNNFIKNNENFDYFEKKIIKTKKKVKNFWRVNNRFYFYNKRKSSFNFVYLKKKWVSNYNYSIYRFNKNTNFYFFKYKLYKKNRLIKSKMKFFIKYFFEKINKKNLFRTIFKKTINNSYIFKNFNIFNSKALNSFVKNYNNNKFSYSLNKTFFEVKQNKNINKCNFIYNNYYKNYVKKNDFYFFVNNNKSIINNVINKKNSYGNYEHKSWVSSVIYNKYFFINNKKWLKIIDKNWIFNQDIKTKQFVNKENFFNVLNSSITAKDYSSNYKNFFFNKNKKFFKNNRSQYNIYRNSLLYKDKIFYNDFFENYKLYENIKNQKNKFCYINFIFITMSYNIFYIFKNINKENFFNKFNYNFFNKKIISNTLLRQNNINNLKNKIISYTFSSFDQNKNIFTIYKNCKYNFKNFNMHAIYSILYSKNYLNRRSIQIIVTPDKNNAYCSIIPYYKNYIKKRSRIYHKSVGSYCKKKGYMRRSRQTRKKFFEEAAFSLLRFSKKKNRYRYLIFKIYHFYDTIKKKFKYKAHKHIKRNFFKFFQKQVYNRFPTIGIEFPKGQGAYGGNKMFKARKKKKRKPFKKISF